MGGQLDGGFGGWVDGCYRGAMGRDIISMGGMGLLLCFVACHTIVSQAADLTLSIDEWLNLSSPWVAEELCKRGTRYDG